MKNLLILLRDTGFTGHSLSSVYFIILLLSGLVLPFSVSGAWQPNGILIEQNLSSGEIAPAGNGGVWVSVHKYGNPVSLLDADGNYIFQGLTLTEADSISPRAYGMFPTSDGGVIIAFRGWAGHENSFCMYAQRFNLDGEKLFGPNGIPIAVEPTNQDGYPYLFNYCSDGAEGFFLYYFHGASGRVSIVGVRGDGEIFLEHQDILPPGEEIQDRSIRIYEDGYGGCWAIFRYNSAVYAQHYLSDGSTEWDEVRQMVPGGFGAERTIVTLPDGGFIFWGQANTHVDLWRIDSEGSPVWETWLRLNRMLTTDMVLLPDTTIASLVVMLDDENFSTTQWLNFNLDGSPVNGDSYITRIGDEDEAAGSVLRMFQNSDSTYLTLHSKVDYDVYRQVIKARLLNTEGVDIWEGNEIILNNMSELSDQNAAYAPGPEGSNYLGITHWNTQIVNREFRIYKINADGTLAGVNKVGEDITSGYIPREIAIISAYPNPFNSEITFKIRNSKAQNLKLKIYNLQGQEVYSMSRFLPAGPHTWSWQANPSLSTGIYFASIGSNSFKDLYKILLIQ